jgi:hypothetical protein
MATLSTQLNFLGANDLGAEWKTVDIGNSKLTIDLNKISSILPTDKVVIAKVVSTLTKDGATDPNSANIAQAEIEFVIKFEK